MKDLHWLPIARRMKFKRCILMHEAMFGQSPSYITVSEIQGRTRLRSPGLYDAPFTRTQFGRCAFSVASPSEWNSLPVNIRQIPDIRKFKRALKTHYITKAYS